MEGVFQGNKEAERGADPGAALQQAEFARTQHRMGAITRGELAENAVDVLLHRADRDHQPVGDLLIGQVIGDEAQDFQFALG